MLAKELEEEEAPWENVEPTMKAIKDELAEAIFQDLVNEFSEELQDML